MKFQMIVGTDYSTVNFEATLKLDVFEKLIHHFERLGGVMIGPKASDWTFPSYITSEVIQEVIRNTCFVCGGLMKDSTAFKNQDIIEIPNGLSMTSHVYSNAGEAKQIKVRKCSSCGHSHT